jgi:hypothetical protein
MAFNLDYIVLMEPERPQNERLADWTGGIKSVEAGKQADRRH